MSHKRIKSKAVKFPPKKAKEVPVSFVSKFIKNSKSIVLKKAALSFPIASRMQMHMEWSDEKKDLEDAWSWGQSRDWRGPIWDTVLLPFLHEYKNKKWHEIENEKSGDDKRHKSYELSSICKEAYDRLEYLKLEDMDEIFRFRIGSKPRFYGFRIQHIFFALWWDAEHRVCPSDIQNRGKVRRK